VRRFVTIVLLGAIVPIAAYLVARPHISTLYAEMKSPVNETARPERVGLFSSQDACEREAGLQNVSWKNGHAKDPQGRYCKASTQLTWR